MLFNMQSLVSEHGVELWPFGVLAPRLKSFTFHTHFLLQDLPVYLQLEVDQA